MSKSRVEAFSDGVIAIIITIIVLLIELPEGDQWNDLGKMLPLVFGYTASFLLIGMRWVNHHHLFQIAASVNGKIIWANLLYLFTLSFFPVVTGWVARTRFAAVPTTTFALLNLIESLAFILLEHTIISSHECVIVKQVISQSKKELITIGLEVAAVAVSFISPLRFLSYVLLVLMSVMWIIPDIRMHQLYMQIHDKNGSAGCSVQSDINKTDDRNK